MRPCTRILLAGLAIFMAASLATAQLQNEPADVDSFVVPQTPPAGQPAFDPRDGLPPAVAPTPPATYFLPERKSSPETAVDKLRDKLSGARTESERAEFRRELREIMERYFEGDMKLRRDKFDELKERADASANALARRKISKDELIDLQLKAFEFQSSGLGLFQNKSSSSVVGPFAVEVILEGNTQRAVVRQAKTQSRISSAMKALNEAKDDDQRKQSVVELRDAMSDYFEEDLKLRQAELQSVNNGLKKMEASLKRRADAKDEIIALQMKIVENEAVGLGFFRKGDIGVSRNPMLFRPPAGSR